MFSTFVYTSSAARLNANTSNSPAARWVSTENSGTSVFAQQRLEIAPRCVRAFGDGVVAFVEDLVEDLQPLVGQPDLVGVGVGEQPRHPVFLVSGGCGTVFAPDVTSRLLHPRQERFEPRPE